MTEQLLSSRSERAARPRRCRRDEKAPAPGKPEEQQRPTGVSPRRYINYGSLLSNDDRPYWGRWWRRFSSSLRRVHGLACSTARLPSGHRCIAAEFCGKRRPSDYRHPRAIEEPSVALFAISAGSLCRSASRCRGAGDPRRLPVGVSARPTSIKSQGITLRPEARAGGAVAFSLQNDPQWADDSLGASHCRLRGSGCLVAALPGCSRHGFHRGHRWCRFQ